jgi:site-specific DNA recombinase
MNVISYARFSTDRQSESSIADQLRVCREHAATKGWLVRAEYSDEGISGAALGNRPGVRGALDDLRQGEALIVTDLSRLSRSQDLAPLVTRLRHRGARVIGVQDGYDSETRHARMQAGLSGIMSEEFRAMVADRTRSALELRARTGQSTGGKPYENVEIVREIFSRFAEGETMKQIASDLNRRDIPSPGANWKQRSSPRGRWLVSALHAILHNERYAGRLVWNRSQWVKDPDTGKRLRRERPESEWIVQTCEPMVDEETWSACQSRFTTRLGRGGAPRYLLSGLLECAVCGSKLIVYGGGQHRYVCGAFHAGGPHACSNSLSVPRATAEERILAPVMDDLLSPEAIAEGVRSMRAERAAPAPATVNPEVATLERMVREGLLSRETAAPALAEAHRKGALATVGATGERPWPTAAAWKAAVEGMREVLRGDDVAAAREALRELIGTVRCRPEGDHIVAELTARQVLLQTGSGRWIGSGGALVVYLPISTRQA